MQVKNILYCEKLETVVDMDSNTGNFNINVPAQLYHEYMAALYKLRSLTKQVIKIAAEQNETVIPF